MEHLLETTGIDLRNGGGIPELIRFQEQFEEYMIVVCGGLNFVDIVFDDQVESKKRINLLYDEVTKHYHVINSLTGAMAQQCVCRGCSKGCILDAIHKCHETTSDCMSILPCAFSGVTISCDACNRNFSSRSCYDRHKTNSLRGKTYVSERDFALRAASCSLLKTEYFKPYCANCIQKEIGHLCDMKPLMNELPLSDDVLFVSYDFETTQDTKFNESATVHLPNLVCLQHFCTACEMHDDIYEDCAHCGTRRHSFFEEPVGDLLSYVCEPGVRRLWL